MSLYNMIHGNNPSAPIVLSLLGKPNVGRLRDAWVERNTAGEFRLAVYTRNGGGNREHYDDESDSGPECTCTGCIITYALPRHPLYLSDADDGFDSTYATVYFRVPQDAPEQLKALGAPDEFSLGDIAVDAPNMAERWTSAIAAISGAS